MLSSDLPDITVFTDHDFVDVRLSAYGNILLAGRYYVLNGTAKVSDFFLEEYVPALEQFYIELPNYLPAIN